MLKSKKISLLLLAGLIQLAAMSQDTLVNKATGHDGFMRRDGKIYVVIAVVVTILSGLIFYVARLDRKITKLEKHGGNI